MVTHQLFRYNITFEHKSVYGYGYNDKIGTMAK